MINRPRVPYFSCRARKIGPLNFLSSPAISDSQHYAYDTESNLLSITDANGHAISFTYDTFGRVTTTMVFMSFCSGVRGAMRTRNRTGSISLRGAKDK